MLAMVMGGEDGLDDCGERSGYLGHRSVEHRGDGAVGNDRDQEGWAAAVDAGI